MKQKKQSKSVSEHMKWKISNQLLHHMSKPEFRLKLDSRQMGQVCGAVRDVIDKINLTNGRNNGKTENI